MTRQADLNPSLGWPGGPCQVVERIEQEVRSPGLREDLAEKVEQGSKLTNSEAAKIYDMETERGAGMIKQIRISPHAQYRMDQRNVTVTDLRLTFTHFTKQFNDWKSQKAFQWKRMSEAMAYGQPIEWLDPKLAKLFTVFTFSRGVATIVTTYWEGMPDPRPETCNLHPRHAAITTEDMSGYQTWVKDPSPSKSDTGKPKGDDGKYPTQGQPTPPWSRSKPVPNQSFNGPGESGSDSGGSVHKDKARTQGRPGGQYDGGATHPLPHYNETGITPNRRPGMTAEEPDELWEDEDEWGDELREAGMVPPAYPGANRQRDQKSQAYRYFHKRYMRKRGPILMRQKRRHKRLKPNGRYQMDRKRRRKTPERFERRPGGGAKTIKERSQKQRDKAKAQNKKLAFAPAVMFFHYPTGLWGSVVDVSPCGFIHFEMDEVGRDVAEFDTFFDEVIIEEDDLQALFDYMDEVFGSSTDGGEGLEPEEDPQFTSWLEGRLPKVSFQVRQRPQTRQRRTRGVDKLRAKQRYRANRMKAKVRSRKRYKRLKKHPAFKKQQQVRRKHPERFKRRMAEVLTAPEIAFTFIQEGMPLGYVRNISGMTGLVSYYLAEPGRRMLRSLPVQDFMRQVVLLSEEDIDAMYDLIDAEIGLEAYDEDVDDLDSSMVNLFTMESEFMHEDDREPDVQDSQLIDPTDDDWFYGVVNKLASEVLGTFFREQRPPVIDPETQFNRGTPISDPVNKRRKDRKPGDPGFDLYEDSVQDSNPGSRVLPSGKGHIEKSAALIKDIREGCGPDLVSRSRGINFRLARADMKNALWLFDVQGSTGAHRVRLKALRKGNMRDIQKAHVKVSCSCPFWKWQGPEHWAKQGGYLYGKPRGMASKPNMKDPSGQHRACKHVLAVLAHVTTNRWSVPDPSGRMASLRYLANTLAEGEVSFVSSDFEMHSKRVAARYLALLEVQ